MPMTRNVGFVFWFLFGKSLCFPAEVDYETKLHRDLFHLYEPDVHPHSKNANKSSVIVVTFDVQVIRILHVNERQQYLEAYMWINQYWENPLLVWNPSDYGGVSSIHVKPAKVWVPDIVLYNSIDESSQPSETLFKSKVLVHSNGRCDWFNPVTLKTICAVDVSYFPFDDQVCRFKFGSWAFDATKIDMLPPRSISTKNNYYIPNGEWELQSIGATRNELFYQCCSVPFVDVTISLRLRRQALNYTFNYIIPAALLSSLVMLGFILPPESGERVGLSITVLLSVTVFQQLSSAIMPSYDFPYLAQYYFATMIQTALSLFATTIVVNFYHRSNRKMPELLRKVLLQWLSKLLFCGKAVKYTPANSLVDQDIDHQQFVGRAGGSRDYEDPLIKEFKNPDHISHVIKLGDGFRSDQCHLEVESNSNLKPSTVKLLRRNAGSSRIQEVLNQTLNSATSLALLDDQYVCASRDEMLKNRKLLTRTERQKEWIRGARVLDRLFLSLFLLMSVVSMIVVFLRAPRFRLH